MSKCQMCGFPTTTGGCTNETCPTREPWRSPMAMVIGDAEARLAAVKASYDAENATLRAENARLREAIRWALGYTDFRLRNPAEGPFWWRAELRERAGFTDDPRPTGDTP